MAYVKFSGTNKAKAQLAAPLTASATSIILKAGQGDLMPQPSTDWPFKLLMEKYNASGVCTAREISRVTARAGDTLTAVRLAENCPASDTATTQSLTAQSFAIDDWVYCVFSADAMDDIQDEVTRLETDKLNKSGALRTGLTASRIIKTNVSGDEEYITPGASNTFLAEDLTFKPITSVLPYIFGDWSDGALVVSSGTTNLVLGTVYNYTTISVANGATISTLGTNGNLILKANISFTLNTTGTINLSAKGSTGDLDTMFGTIARGTLGAGGNGGAGGTVTTFIGGAGGTGSALGFGGGGGGGACNPSGSPAMGAGGAGGAGGTPAGLGGTGAVNAAGNPGGLSAGGGGGSPGGGNAGTRGAAAYGGTAPAFAGGGSGGGAGNTFGTAGANFVGYFATITGTGTINTAGGTGGNGSNGGAQLNGAGYNSGGGGGGGGGGQGGAQLIVANSGAVFAGTSTRSGGAGGTGGNGGTVVAGGVAGAAGTAGTAGGTGTLYNRLVKDTF